mmetsp:Transcript_272/g.269  ORF Transcript_272/g.269 Transcript_272/m.269 type:complete len:99 (+) Transcript_272:143-439(+)
MKIVHILKITSRDQNFRRTNVEFMIGSGTQNDLEIMSKEVSHLHAQITCSKGRFFIKDSNSHNGTFVYPKEAMEIPIINSLKLQIGTKFVSFQLEQKS